MTHNDIGVQRLFAEGANVIAVILERGMEEYIADVDVALAVARDRWIRCIDEGTPGGLHLAGSGILLGEDWEESLERAAEVVREMDADGISWHRGCGAVAHYVKSHNEVKDDVDEVAERFARELAVKVALPCREQMLMRPGGLHIARAVYYDGAGQFDPSRVEGLPSGFVISRRYLSKAYALKEAEMAVGIALGHHGFSELFTREQPLLLVAVGGDGGLERELTEVAKPYGRRVTVVSLG